MENKGTDDIKSNASGTEGNGQRWMARLPAIVFLGLASYFLLRGESYAAPKHVEMAKLTMKRLDGSLFEAHSLAGRAVVLNFWAPWCPPCRLEMPWLQDLQSKHPELTVVGVENDSDEYGNAIDLANHTGIHFPLVRSSEDIQEAFGQIAGLPTTLYISPSGRVVHTVTGVIPQALMTRYAKDAVAAK
jgi:cytochrome c biogenesis protein CcmG/thiol:disulfide interchange protein DsbE